VATRKKTESKCDDCIYRSYISRYRDLFKKHRLLRKRYRKMIKDIQKFRQSYFQKWGRHFEDYVDRLDADRLFDCDIPLLDRRYRVALIHEQIAKARDRNGCIKSVELKRLLELVWVEVGVAQMGRAKGGKAGAAGSKSKPDDRGAGGGATGQAGRGPRDDYGRGSKRLPDLDIPEDSNIGADVSDEELEAALAMEKDLEEEKAVKQYFKTTGDGQMDPEAANQVEELLGNDRQQEVQPPPDFV